MAKGGMSRRGAGSGRFVTNRYAKNHLNATVGETRGGGYYS